MGNNRVHFVATYYQIFKLFCLLLSDFSRRYFRGRRVLQTGPFYYYFFFRLQFRFVHHQAAMVVALRSALDYLLVRAATTPGVIAEPDHMDEKILHVFKSLSRANAGCFGVQNQQSARQFPQRGHPPGSVKFCVNFYLKFQSPCHSWVEVLSILLIFS